MNKAIVFSFVLLFGFGGSSKALPDLTMDIVQARAVAVAFEAFSKVVEAYDHYEVVFQETQTEYVVALFSQSSPGVITRGSPPGRPALTYRIDKVTFKIIAVIRGK